MKEATCKHCGAAITWGKSKFGRPMPMNLGGTIHFGTCVSLKRPKEFPTECVSCGSENLEVGPGVKMHAGALKCGDCGRHVKWLSKADFQTMTGQTPT